LQKIKQPALLHLLYKTNIKMQTEKIQFAPSNHQFYKQLAAKVRSVITEDDKQSARVMLWIKLAVFSILFITANVCLYLPIHYNTFGLLLNFIAIGWIGILLAFNASHDAAHNTFSKKQSINYWIYHITFNLQGVNAYLWRIRHKSSHHVFANVDGCDADIDDNILLRLSPTHSHKFWHKYQHIYAFALYTMYTLHWIFFKDFVYLGKKNLANLKNQSHSKTHIAMLFVWKMIYLSYMIILPIYFSGFSVLQVLISFLVMHIFISIFFVHSLIISHLCMQTVFPTVNDNGVLPFNYHQHQLEVSLDYHADSVIASWIFGGFNTHTAHHLFPNLPHTLYRKITPIIQQVSAQFQYPYHALSYPKAIASHYQYLKKLGNDC
jgi:linoleoyl-CoA desaturase